MLKSLFKKNLTISCLISLSFFVIINNFFRFFQNNAAYEFDAWLSNYQGGFVRRGIPGELFYQLNNIANIHPGWVTFIFVSLLYLMFYFFFLKILNNIKINKLLIFAIFSPIGFFYPLLNSKASGHKEIIFLGLLALFCCVLPKLSRNKASYFMIIIITVVGLAHEGLIFYLLYLIVPFIFFYEFKNIKEIIINLAPISIVSFFLLLLNYYFRGSEQHVIDICNSVKNYVNSGCLTSGQIYSLKVPVQGYVDYKTSAISHGDKSLYKPYFTIYGIGFLVGFLPLIILFAKSKLAKPHLWFSKINPLIILLLPFLLTLPVYYIGSDWGRYLYACYMSTLTIGIFFLKNNIFINLKEIQIIKSNIITKFFFILIVAIYGFGWTVPLCCEREFKPGLGKIIYKSKYFLKGNF